MLIKFESNPLAGNGILTMYAGNGAAINYPQHTYTAVTFERFHILTRMFLDLMCE